MMARSVILSRGLAVVTVGSAASPPVLGAAVLDMNGLPIGSLRLGELVLVLGGYHTVTSWSDESNPYAIQERLVLTPDGTVGLVRQGRLANV